MAVYLTPLTFTAVAKTVLQKIVVKISLVTDQSSLHSKQSENKKMSC